MAEPTTRQLDKGRLLDNPQVAARYRLNDIFATAWLSHAISALVAHGVFDLIGSDAAHVDELAQKAKLHQPTLYRVLRAVAANGILAEDPPGHFSHTETSRILRHDHEYSWSGMSKMWNHRSCLSAWSQLPQALKDGRSGIEHAFGKPLYAHLEDTPGGTQDFADAMIANSKHAAQAIARKFPFEKYNTVTDIAGGVGTLLSAILQTHTHMTGALLEIAELKQAAQEQFAALGLADRTEFVVGDFFEKIDCQSELYLIKNSLWNWSDSECLTIMKNVRQAIGQDSSSRFIIIEYMIEQQNACWTTLYDLQILNMPGGKARSTSEYAALLGKANFALDGLLRAQDQTLLVARPL